MKHTQLLVEQALQNYPETRDSDKKLMLRVWTMQDPFYDSHFEEFFLHKGFNPETIRRMRQKLQEQGKYPASKKVNEKRYEKFTQMQGYGSATVETVNETLW